MRSTVPPRTRATVIAAKVIWKQANTNSGMVPESESLVTPAMNILPNPPTKALPLSPKAIV